MIKNSLLVFLALLFTSCVFFISGCSTTIKEEPAIVLAEFKSGFPQQAWAEHALSEVKKSGLQSVKVSDPWFKGTEHDWVHLLAAMSRYESGHKQNTAYKECSVSAKTYGSSGKWFASEGKYCIPGHALDGGVAISRGLLQISMQSANGYGCGIKHPSELHDPFVNISCGILILKHWAKRDGVISSANPLRGAARYWSVLRPSGKLESVKKTYLELSK